MVIQVVKSASVEMLECVKFKKRIDCKIVTNLQSTLNQNHSTQAAFMVNKGFLESITCSNKIPKAFPQFKPRGHRRANRPFQPPLPEGS